MRFSPRRNVTSAGGLPILLLALLAGAAAADEEEGWRQEYVPEAPAWKEQETELPAWPDAGRQLEVTVNQANFPFRVFIDPESLSIGEDRVLRYTVVVVSASGARNISYEGIRCSKRSYRRYAYGAGDEWVPLAAEPWRPLLEEGMDSYRYVLYRDYLCDPANPYQNTGDVLQRIRYPRGSGIGE
jgi:hypothetical protein